MSVVRIGGSLISVDEEGPDPAERFRAATVLSPEEQAAEQRSERIEAATSAFATAEPPTAQELSIKIADLPPVRQELARIHAWIAKLQRERADFQGGRGALLAKLGIPATTEAAIAELETSDRSGLLSWMKGGGKVQLPTIARQYEREQLQAKLSSDSYEASVARDALDTVEEQIDILQRQIEIVTKRRQSAAKLALIEHARDKGAKYAAALRAVEAAVAPLLGLADVVDDRDFYAMDRTLKTMLPSFGLSTIPGNQDAVTGEYGPLHGSTRVTVDERWVSEEARPWQRQLAAWIENPRAKPEV
jgi:hypothetical protein